MKIFLYCIFIALLLGCSGPYDELEKAFPVRSEINGEMIKSKTIMLSSRNHKGAYNYREIATVSLSPEFVEIDISMPTFNRVQIPIEEISGCGKTCFGSTTWDADILLGNKCIEISFSEASEIIDWCWENNLPVITGKDKRNWMYNNGILPSRETYKQVSKEEYMRQVARCCQGY